MSSGPHNPKHAQYVLQEWDIDPTLFLEMNVTDQRVFVSLICGRDVKGLYWRENFTRAAANIAELRKRKNS